MNLIASVDRNWAIGNKNQLLVSIPNDMKCFREMTNGQIVVLGRKTLETFPNGLPLQNRNNIVLTRVRESIIKHALVVHSVEELLEQLAYYNDKEIFIIGGQNVYEQMLPYCNTAYITKIDHSYEADAYLENLDHNSEWKLVEESEEQTYFDLEYVFRKYIRIEGIKNE